MLRDLAFRRSIKSMQENIKKAEQHQEEQLQQAKTSIDELDAALAEAESLTKRN